MFMENRVAADDPRRETVYRNFAANLQDIVDAGLNAGAHVVLSTVSVNLRDCPPFGSIYGSGTSEIDRQRFDEAFTAAKTLQQEGNPDAAARFADALEVDALFAEAHYRRAECLAPESPGAAREHFQHACDTDALAFRADTRINSAIRKLAAGGGDDRLMFCDAEAKLAADGLGGIAGKESFYEHVHFNFEGNYRLGKAWAEQVAQMLPPEARRDAANEWASRTDCERALGLTAWNWHFVTQSVIRRLGQPPLSMQSNNEERLQAVRAEDEDFRRQQRLPGAIEQVRAEFEALIQASPEDSFLHEGFANFLEAIKDPRGAAAAYRRAFELMPDDFYNSLQLGRLLGELGSPAEGEPFLRNAVRLRPSISDGWHELGLVLAAQEKFSSALKCMQRAEQLRPQDPANVCYTGKMLAQLGRRAEAIEKYQRAIQMRPAYWEARFELANELAFQNQLDDAMRQYVEVLKLNPRHATAQVNLGVVFTRLNRLDEAMLHFEEALRLEPDHRAAREYLHQVTARRAKSAGPKPF
jgi:tetratricopeptide (TPR) repeat protein